MVRILTWNVASLKTLPPKLTGQSLETFFDAHSADIVCLQETKISDYAKLTKDIAVVTGFDSFFSFSGKGYAGVATFARKGSTRWWTDNPFTDQIGGPKEAKASSSSSSPSKSIDPDTDPDVSIGRCVLTDHASFLLLNIYAPNAGRGPAYLERKFTFYATLARCVSKWHQAGRSVIVTGDINTAHQELDIYNPEKYKTGTGFLPEERAWITTLLHDQHMSDAFRRLYPDTRTYSFWDQRRMQRAPNNGWRIDVFYCSNALLESDVLIASESEHTHVPADTAKDTVTGHLSDTNDNTNKVSSIPTIDTSTAPAPAPAPAQEQVPPNTPATYESEILTKVTGSDHCPITLTLPRTELCTTLTCKDASSNRASLNPRRIDGFFFNASVRGQGVKRPVDSDSEGGEGQGKSKEAGSAGKKKR